MIYLKNINFFNNASVIQYSDIYNNDYGNSLIFDVDGNFSSARVYIQGKTSINSQWYNIATLSLSDNSINTSISSSGIYISNIIGVKYIRLNITEISGAISIFGRITTSYVATPSSGGAPGADGVDGKDGTVWYTGNKITGESTTPQIFETGIAYANSGDMYLNTQTSSIYICDVPGIESTATWYYSCNIKGNSGQNGESGTYWYSGENIDGNEVNPTIFPNSGIDFASLNDMYFNTLNANIYKCVLGGDQQTAKWSYISNIMGIRGRDGKNGTDGINGKDGKNGNLWYTGDKITGEDIDGNQFSTGIENANVGDMYLNSNTSNVYECIMSGDQSVAQWKYIMNIKGQMGLRGEQGVPGTDGTDGIDGKNGATWYNGSAIGGNSTIPTIFPDTGISNANINDLYLTTREDSIGNVYICTKSGVPSSAEWKYLVNIRGEQGEQGIPGENGKDGTNGIDGVNGKDGENGNKWYTGTEIYGEGEVDFSIQGQVNIGDMYLNSENGNVYQCIKNNPTQSWEYIENIVGPQGIQGQQGPQGIQGIQGVQGIPGTDGTNGADGVDGKDGTVWYTGSAITGNSVNPTSYLTGILNANINDLYLTNADNSVGNVYICVVGGDENTARWKYFTNIRGQQGPQGIQGIEGERGEQGIQGQTGEPGKDGENGNKWYTGTAINGNGIFSTGIENANVGDMYLNNETWNIYQCVLGGSEDIASWDYVTNIRGAQGEQGEQGEQGIPGRDGTNGANGEDGKNGATWYSGINITGNSTMPTNFPQSEIEDAQIGDLYLNTENGNVYKCFLGGDPSTATWIYITNIIGPRGIQGEPGRQGDVGPQGIQGETGEKGEPGEDGRNGGIWYSGSIMTGTGQSVIFANSNINMAYVGDMYINNSNLSDSFCNVYRCSTEGIPSVAKWDYVINIRGAQGIQGVQGQQGIQGQQGVQGKAATIQIMPVITGEPGTNAMCTNEGTEYDAVLQFTIPRGNTGATGQTGQQGIQGEKGDPGESAYEQAVSAGYTGTEEEFYEALVLLKNSPFLSLSGGNMNGYVIALSNPDISKLCARNIFASDSVPNNSVGNDGDICFFL